jgi:RNA polymerase sigma factor (sigma-70 family)
MHGAQPDSDLWHRFRGGEPSALAEIYWAHVGRVERLLSRGLSAARGGPPARVGTRGGDLADLVQEVFLKAFSRKSRQSFNENLDFAPYVSTIARNVLVDWLRKSGKEIPLDGQALAATADGLAWAEENDGPWTDPRTLAIVRDYLRELSPQLRLVHEKRYVMSLSQREAAAELGITRQVLRTQEEQLRHGLERALQEARPDRPVVLPPAPRERSASK